MDLRDLLTMGLSARGIAVLTAVLVSGCQPSVGPTTSVASVIETATTVGSVQAQAAELPGEGSPLKITWEELDVGMEPDSLFEPWMMTTRVKALEGKQVRIAGYMSGAIFQKDNVREFPLLREKGCPFGPGGQAHHVMAVELQGKLRTSFSAEPIVVEGTFTIQPRTGPNGKTWSLYRLDATKIESKG